MTRIITTLFHGISYTCVIIFAINVAQFQEDSICSVYANKSVLFLHFLAIVNHCWYSVKTKLLCVYVSVKILYVTTMPCTTWHSEEWWSHGRAPDCQSRGRWFYPPAAVSKLRQFCSPHICLCLSEETLKAVGPFYLVCMLGEVKDPAQGVNV